MARGLWTRVKELALTDVGVLVRGMGRAELDLFERALIESDLGVTATMELVDDVTARVRGGKLKTADDVRAVLEERLTAMLSPEDGKRPGEVARAAEGPTVILLAGVNGSGKTTAAAKLAKRLAQEGRKPLLVAADTYRAGAVQQLDEWAARIGVPCVKGASGGDPAAVAFDAVGAAISRGLDTVIVDTAGRLHTQDDLMKEVQKIARVVGRKAPGAPHETFLVLDGSTGQNAVQQGKIFSAALPITGLIVTKLDGTAKGGTVVALRRDLKLPVRFLGVGETADDLEVFDPKRYAARLLED
ncbi:MAG: signal recognition particle-docking protein FtsY [Gemmatimonadetes bacterium GWC2_71_10]|nr:MAG: signal recognition particle-docking protein FtsY [Gemmatimonadetes bacterium GWC2_71_10]